MKPFKIGKKVEILHSGDDEAPKWTPGEVVNVVRPNMKGRGQTGNNVRIANGKFVQVTEPLMIREIL